MSVVVLSVVWVARCTAQQTVSIEQGGHDNIVTAEQTGRANEAVIWQPGEANTVQISQSFTGSATNSIGLLRIWTWY